MSNDGLISLGDSLLFALQWAIGIFALRILSFKALALKSRYFDQSISFLIFASLVTYVFWLWGSLLVLPAYPVLVFGICALTAIAFCHFLPKHSDQKDRMVFSMHAELIFWFVFVCSVWIRVYSPKLDIGEKYADLMILQGCLQDLHFPPMDRWLVGHSLNYYYYGQLFFMPLARMLSIPPEVLFHLITCTVAACFADTSFSIARHLGAGKKLALLSAMFAIFLCNWHWMESYLHPVKNYFWWWDASRAIPNTITEFPFFSLLLGDLHAHFIGLPFLNASLAAAILAKEHLSRENTSLKKWLFVFVCAVLLGQNYPLNAWQLPCLALLCGFILRRQLKALTLLAFLSVLLFLPFWLQYHKPSAAAGLFYVPKSMRSELWFFFLHWAPFFCLLALLAIKSAKEISKKQWLILSSLGVTLSFVISPAIGPFFILVAVLFISRRNDLNVQTWILLFLAMFCIVFVELFSLDRTYGDPFLRLNTVFKFYMMAWWSLAICIPVMLDKIRLPKFLIASVVLLSLGYTYLGSKSRFSDKSFSPTLDGLVAWGQEFIDERPVINWIRKNTGHQAVILEASGGGYEKYARISTFAGRPTVIGWLNHEQVWRSNGYQLAFERTQEIKDLSDHFSTEKLNSLIVKYNIQYVMLGQLERQNWSPALIDGLAQLPIAFQFGNAVLFSTKTKPN